MNKKKETIEKWSNVKKLLYLINFTRAQSWKQVQTSLDIAEAATCIEIWKIKPFKEIKSSLNMQCKFL